jgi:hypothetical protein
LRRHRQAALHLLADVRAVDVEIIDWLEWRGRKPKWVIVRGQQRISIEVDGAPKAGGPGRGRKEIARARQGHPVAA